MAPTGALGVRQLSDRLVRRTWQFLNQNQYEFGPTTARVTFACCHSVRGDVLVEVLCDEETLDVTLCVRYEDVGYEEEWYESCFDFVASNRGPWFVREGPVEPVELKVDAYDGVTLVGRCVPNDPE